MADALSSVRLYEDNRLRERWNDLSQPEKIREYYYDANARVPNERAWEVMQATKIGGPLFAQYSIEGVAWTNDNFGHDAGQMLYRAAAEALRQVDARIAKDRGDFAGKVESLEDAHFRAKQATRLMPPEFQGFTITCAVGNTWDEAKTNHVALKQQLENEAAKPPANVPADWHPRSGRGRKPHRVAAGWSPQAPAVWAEEDAQYSAARREARGLHHDLTEAFRAVDPNRAFEQCYRDPMTGVLGHTGMGAMERRGDKILSIDVDGLKTTDSISRLLGDEVVKVVGRRMGQLQEELGESMNVAHPHGDEYGAAHPDERKLRAFAELLREDLASLQIPYVDVEKKLTYAQHGIGLSYGIGRDHDQAEHDLKRHKAERAERGERDLKGAEQKVATARIEVRAATEEELAAARLEMRARVERQDRIHMGMTPDHPGVQVRRFQPPPTRAAPSKEQSVNPPEKRPPASRERGETSRRRAPSAPAIATSNGHEVPSAAKRRGEALTIARDEINRLGIDDQTLAEFRRNISVNSAGVAFQKNGVGWDSGTRAGAGRVVVVEREIDALSHRQLHRNEPMARYVAVGAALSAEKLQHVKGLAKEAPVVSAFGNSREGAQLASQLAASLPPDVKPLREAPAQESWSAALCDRLGIGGHDQEFAIGRKR
jgi:GGDEF domain-containing protein